MKMKSLLAVMAASVLVLWAGYARLGRAEQNNNELNDNNELYEGIAQQNYYELPAGLEQIEGLPAEPIAMPAGEEELVPVEQMEGAPEDVYLPPAPLAPAAGERIADYPQEEYFPAEGQPAAINQVEEVEGVPAVNEYIGEPEEPAVLYEEPVAMPAEAGGIQAQEIEGAPLGGGYWPAQGENNLPGAGEMNQLQDEYFPVEGQPVIEEQEGEAQEIEGVPFDGFNLPGQQENLPGAIAPDISG